MKRRGFIAGLFAAPVAAKLAAVAPIEPIVAFDLSAGADFTATGFAQGGNVFLTDEAIAKEALAILRNNLVYRKITAKDYSPDYEGP